MLIIYGFWRFLKNQLIIENTFVKQMSIFFYIWYFDRISANSKLSQQRSFVHPQFFQNFGFSSWAICRVFTCQTWVRYIWCIYVQKFLHHHFGQAERGATWSKCLIFCGAQLSNSQLWGGAGKNQNIFWKAQASVVMWFTKTESSL